MDEWWTYRLADFLLFSPRTYYRMLERYNAAVWPGHLVTLGLGVAIAALLRRPAAWQGRAVSASLAGLWAWLAWGFFWRRYATINWMAPYFGWLFVVEAVLLVWIGVVRGGLTFRVRREAAGVLGVGLLALSLAFYPLLAPLLGRGWRQSEVFGIAPDPTVISTLALLLLAPGTARWTLLVPPLLWCVVGGATLWAMGSPETLVMLLASVASAYGGGRRRP